MREIKFRAFDKEKKRMIASVGFGDSDAGRYWKQEEYMIGGGESSRDWIPMQFTGLLDKNGKQICEGDIVMWKDGEYKHPSNPRIAEVRFDPELCFFAFNVDGGHKFGYSNFAYSDTEKHLEIIGNIHQNPELLNA